MTNVRFRYRDNNPDTAFYPAIFIDSAVTNDVGQIYSIHNELFFEWLPNLSDTGKNKWSFYVGGRYDFERFTIEDDDTTFNNQLIIGGFRAFQEKKYDLKLEGDYVTSGYNSGDWSGKLNFDLPLKGYISKIELKGTSKRYAPDLFQQVYASNHYAWNNNFVKTNVNEVAVRANHHQQFSLEAGYTGIDQLIYFDTLALPRQQNEAISILHLEANANLKYKKWHFHNSLRYQSITGGEGIRLPDYYLLSSIFYQTRTAFKGNLTAKLGLEVVYYPEYFGNAYAPATGVFHLQNDRTIGNYPFANVFLNVRIKQVRAFVKVQHANSGLLDYNYWAAPGYPIHDRAIKIGLEWKFYN